MVDIAGQAHQRIGSPWFDVSEAQDMVEMAAAGTLELSVFEHERYPLRDITKALEAVDRRAGGFANVGIVHE
ncbi:hypothetical protein QA640_02980 [Bradyrhizobium sp. CB82]|uniref:hypothetical protein n=1 Tax=Bradyrhizobium sp. CB82 TaxID=3039159 RepID=UPI0024B0F6F1|nr:hypothetical protein [Bradyrhizobium sp. CB82]WFU41511.1 hypothetical protein QA640_02980 [Bradyrhizobium sp. CB82]